MALWIGEGCLSIGGGKRIFQGESIPAGALSQERLQELSGQGKVDLTDGRKAPPVAPQVEEIPRVRVRAPVKKPDKVPEVLEEQKPVRAKKSPKKPPKKRARKKKDVKK